MAPLIAPGICRYAVNQTYAGRNVVNIIDMRVDTTGSIETRADAVYGVAGDILNNWDDHLRPGQVAQLILESVSWVDLDDVDGSTGLRSSTSDKTWPAAGEDAANGLPGSVAGLIVKTAPGGGRSTRNGRMYFAGIAEAATTLLAPNTIDGTSVTGRNASLADFLEGINDTVDPSDVQKQMVVVHTRKVGSVVTYEGSSDVTSLLLQPTLATQRRRLRG